MGYFSLCFIRSFCFDASTSRESTQGAYNHTPSRLRKPYASLAKTTVNQYTARADIIEKRLTSKMKKSVKAHENAVRTYNR